MMNDDKKPHNDGTGGASGACPLPPEKSPEDKEFYLEYGENLAAGDLRPIVIEDYVEE